MSYIISHFTILTSECLSHTALTSNKDRNTIAQQSSRPYGDLSYNPRACYVRKYNIQRPVKECCSAYMQRFSGSQVYPHSHVDELLNCSMIRSAEAVLLVLPDEFRYSVTGGCILFLMVESD